MTEVGEIARLRQGLYRFFAAALTHPDASRLELLRTSTQLLRQLAISDFAYASAWRRVEERLAIPPDAALLGVEYVRMFASGTDGALCPPTESFYVAKAEGGGIADAVAVLQRTYHQLGLHGLGPEAPDHIASELNALAGLCHRETDAWESFRVAEAVRELSRQHLFLGRHLMSWFPRFRMRVAAASRDGFYAEVVHALDAFLVHESDWTKALVTRVEVEA